MNPAAVAGFGLVVAPLVVGCSSSDDETGATSAPGEPISSRTATPTLDPALTGRMEIDQRI